MHFLESLDSPSRSSQMLALPVFYVAHVFAAIANKLEIVGCGLAGVGKEAAFCESALR